MNLYEFAGTHGTTHRLSNVIQESHRSTDGIFHHSLIFRFESDGGLAPEPTLDGVKEADEEEIEGLTGLPDGDPGDNLDDSDEEEDKFGEGEDIC